MVFQNFLLLETLLTFKLLKIVFFSTYHRYEIISLSLIISFICYCGILKKFILRFCTMHYFLLFMKADSLALTYFDLQGACLFTISISVSSNKL